MSNLNDEFEKNNSNDENQVNDKKNTNEKNNNNVNEVDNVSKENIDNLNQNDSINDTASEDEKLNEIKPADDLNNNVEYNYKEQKYKKKRYGRTISFIAGGLICAIVGGIIGAFSMYPLVMKKSQKIERKEEIVNVPHFSNEEGALSVPEVVQNAAPSVVGVSTKSLVRDQFDIREQEGIGSGFIINEEGLVVTNYHVVKGAQEVKVILNDGSEVNAKVVNYDEENDIAVVKITDDVKMPGVAVLGDSSTVKPGEDVIAIGNPLGKEFSSTVTKGIVSSPNRKLTNEKNNVVEYIQTDAAINPGNSGGPLINARGQVIGINTAKKVGAEIEGIGFAIPINKVKERLGALSKPILKIGIQAINVDEKLAKEKDLVEGIYVKGVQEFSPAEKAGLRIGDIIIKFGGERVKTVEELNKFKEKYNNGDVVKMIIIRDGQEKVVEIKLTA